MIMNAWQKRYSGIWKYNLGIYCWHCFALSCLIRTKVFTRLKIHRTKRTNIPRRAKEESLNRSEDCFDWHQRPLFIYIPWWLEAKQKEHTTHWNHVIIKSLTVVYSYQIISRNFLSWSCGIRTGRHYWSLSHVGNRLHLQPPRSP